MNPDPQTMTTDEIRDALAEMDGWKCRSAVGNHWWERPNPIGMNIHRRDGHPHPPTRDGAAKAMPEGWEWDRFDDVDHTKGDTLAFCIRWSARLRIDHSHIRHYVSVIDTGDEIRDRYCLAYLCRLAEKGTENV